MRAGAQEIPGRPLGRPPCSPPPNAWSLMRPPRYCVARDQPTPPPAASTGVAVKEGQLEGMEENGRMRGTKRTDGFWGILRMWGKLYARTL